MGKDAEGLKIQLQKIGPVLFLLNIKPSGILLHKEMPGKEPKKKKRGTSVSFL